MHSTLYEGSVRHRRFAPVRHEFRHRLALAYLDLDELAAGDLGPITGRGPRLVRYRRADYLGAPDTPLDDAVRDFVEARSGQRPAGPVRVLTQLRTAGWNFNPITLYYCFDRTGGALEAVVYEVTNTPWGDRHAYLVRPDEHGRFQNIAMDKALHVSPFLPMDLEYQVTCPVPGRRAVVHFALRRRGELVFDADLACRAVRALDRRGVRRLALRHPVMPLVVSFEIYIEALRLLVRRAPFHPNPGPTAVEPASTPSRHVA